MSTRIAEMQAVRFYLKIWKIAHGLIQIGLHPLISAINKNRIDSEDDLYDIAGTIGGMELTDAEIVSTIEVASEIISQLSLPFMPVPTEFNQITIANQVEWISLLLGHWLDSLQMGEELINIGDKINGYVVKELGRVIPIDIRRSSPGITFLIDKWREDNIGLIRSGIQRSKTKSKSVLEEVSELVEKAHANGWRVEELSKELRDKFDVSRSRATLIARDQVLKLNGQINQYRQEELGITKYKWITSRDGKVRDSHKKMHGTINDWATPPRVGRGFYHPGQDIQCRCTASPVFEDTDL